MTPAPPQEIRNAAADVLFKDCDQDARMTKIMWDYALQWSKIFEQGWRAAEAHHSINVGQEAKP